MANGDFEVGIVDMTCFVVDDTNEAVELVYAVGAAVEYVISMGGL